MKIFIILAIVGALSQFAVSADKKIKTTSMDLNTNPHCSTIMFPRHAYSYMDFNENNTLRVVSVFKYRCDLGSEVYIAGVEGVSYLHNVSFKGYGWYSDITGERIARKKGPLYLRAQLAEGYELVTHWDYSKRTFLWHQSEISKLP